MKRLFQLLKETGLTPNGYYLMDCLSKNLSLDLPIPYSTETHKLKLLGYLDDKHSLTPKAIELIGAADAIINNPKETVVGQTIITDDFKAQVAKYREVFPKGVVNGKALRGGTGQLTARFVWFFKEFPQYTWQHVLNATQNYINSFGTDLTYCKTAVYFIKKDDKNKNTISLLADWCEAELDTEREEPVKHIIGFNRLV